MAEYVLITEDKYDGQYVALRSFADNEVVAAGNDPVEVMKSARAGGVDDPVLFFVPKHGMTLVY